MTSIQTEPTADGVAEFLSFRLGDEEFCLDIMAVREIRSWTQPTPLPRAPACLSGVINLRGTILPVIDLAARLGLAPAAADPRHVIIVVERGGQCAGLVVAVVAGIVTLATGTLEPPPAQSATTAGGCLAALSLCEGRMLRIIDLGAVLPGSTVAAA